MLTEDLNLHNSKLAQNYRQIRQKDRFAVFYQHWILGKIVDLLGKNPERLLDYCCGSCILYPFISKNSQYIGIDFSEEMLKPAKEKFINESNFQVFQQDGQHLNFPENYFEAVIAKGALHHLINTKAGLSEIKRVLDKKGVLVLAEPASSFFLKKMRQLIYSRNSHFAKSHRAFSRQELLNFLKQAGFQPLEIVRYGLFSHLLAYPDIFKPARYLPYRLKKWLFYFDNFLLKLPLVRNLSLGLMIKSQKI